MDKFQEWNAIEPGIIALKHTSYEIRHELVGGSWYFNGYWRVQCVRPCGLGLDWAKRDVMSHLNDMLQMGYEV